MTDHRGVGVSRPLSLGRYLIEEIVSPAFYIRSDQVLDVTIEHSGQIIRQTFYNEPANVGVEVRKIGPAEVMAGQPIIWDITTIANASSISLSDFYVRDILPAHVVRLDRVFTGTFNQQLRYSVMFRTNTNDQWRVAYDNLLSTTNNALVMSPAALSLASGEFVTEIMFQFGTVRAGFRNVENPRLEGTVLDGLPDGYEFANRIDIGGRTGSEWVIGNSVWTTRIFRPAGRHPRTGS
ncbi:MAG: prealbumin-like fold domain-containing protein [Defluviitaleaceae bacterium]|nr:prealbumin-like fold domain-containing protein [Defluviitaleaceae bacterium]